MRSIFIGLIGLFSLGLSPALAADAATLEANKKAVLEFYDAALNRKDFDPPPNISGRITSSTIRPRRTASRASRISSISCARNFRTRAARSSAPLPTATT
jgi:hypothetical protein